MALLLVILAALWIYQDPTGIAPPSFLATGEEVVRASFTACGPGRGRACVVDGDTFKLGERKIRIEGIDAPEVNPPRCPEEARLGAQATERLRSLLNEGPFAMQGWAHRDRDQYGRELMTVTRKRPDGTTQDIGDAMVEAGLAQRYRGFKAGWC